MNKNQLASKWNELKNQVREKWHKLSNDDIASIHGNVNKLSEQLQQKYGWSKDHADREIDRFCETCESKMRQNREEQEWRQEGNEPEEKMEKMEKMQRGPELHRGTQHKGQKPEDKMQKYGENQEKKRKVG